MHSQSHPLAGQTVTVIPAASLYGHTGTDPVEFRVEDWNDRVFGRSWQVMAGNPACLGYAVRAALGGLPSDNEVVYGKVGSLGHLVHVDEIA